MRTGALVTIHGSFFYLATQVGEVATVSVMFFVVGLFLTSLRHISLIKLKVTRHESIESRLTLLFDAYCFFSLLLLKLLNLLPFELSSHLLLRIELLYVIVL